MPPRLRIFLSSPGDVREERLRAHLVVAKLAREFARYFVVEPYLWEHEPMLASGHFQDAIELPSAADIVVLVLWSRLGTPLPETTLLRSYRGIDGRAPVTGTEWEFEEALAAHRAGGAPDLLAYRRGSEPRASVADLAQLASAREQYEKVEAFWRLHFEDRGVFLAGSARFQSLDEFDARLEADLRRLIERRIATRAAEQGGVAPTWLGGSPFRGLAAYDFADAPIFFGRDGATRDALTRLLAAASNGAAFLLVLGASGSGKSSLARAGLIPSLVSVKSVAGVGAWRRVAIRPGASADPIRALAEALLAGQGTDGEGLAELAAAGSAAPALAAHLRAAAADPSYPFRTALEAIARGERGRGRLLAHEEVRLVLLVDQLEELFTGPDLAPDDADLFVAILSGLARSGLVWVVATMRSDLWHRAAAQPRLLALTEAGARFDLLPPNGAETLEMVRQPAAAAGLTFERHPDSGLGLDAVVAAAAAWAPGALPLLSVLLDAIYLRDVAERGDVVLRFETYADLGELRGAIARRAEDVVARLAREDEDAAATLPDVLRSLVTVGREVDAVTARPFPLDGFPERTPARRLVDALLAPGARLLTAEDRGGGASVHLAHEALIEHWPRAREQIARDRRDIATRVRLDSLQRRHADAAPRDRRRALLTGLALEEGRDLARRWGLAPSDPLGAFVAASVRVDRVRRGRVTLSAALLVAMFAAVAAFAGLQWRRADAERQTAQAAQAVAEQRRREASVRLDEALLNDSRFLAKSAEEALADGDASQAAALARRALPSSLDAPDRPILKEALTVLSAALRRDPIEAILCDDGRPLASAEFGPSGRTVVTSSQDGAVRVWDVAGGRLVGATDSGMRRPRVAASHDETRIAIFGPDRNAGRVRIWTVEEGKVDVLQPEPSSIQHVEFLSGADLIASVTFEGTILLWDGATRQLRHTLTGHAPGRLVTASDRSGRLIVGDRSGAVKVWATSSGELVASARHAAEVTAISFVDGTDEVAAVGSDGTVRVWDAKLETERVRFAVTGQMPAFSPDGRRLLTVDVGDAPDSDASVRLWQVSSGLRGATVLGRRRSILEAWFSPDGKTVATTGPDLKARLWQADTGAAAGAFGGHTQAVRSVAVRADGKLLLTGSEDGRAILWRTEPQDRVRRLGAVAGGLAGLAFDATGEQVFAVGRGGTLSAWKSEASGRRQANLVLGPMTGSAAFSPDRTLVLAVQVDGVGVWHVGTGRRVSTLERLGSALRQAVWSGDGRQVLAVDGDGRAGSWDARTGLSIHELAPGGVALLAASPDGTSVATAAGSGEVRLLDGRSGQLRRQLASKGSPAAFLGFMAEGRELLAISEDGEVRAWSTGTGADIFAWRTRPGVTEAAISSDARRLALVANRSVDLFELRSGAELARNAHVGGKVSFGLSGGFLTAVSLGSVRVWDTATGAEIDDVPIPSERFFLDDAVSGPDGRRLAAANSAGEVHLAEVWLPDGGAVMDVADVLAVSRSEADNRRQRPTGLSNEPETADDAGRTCDELAAHPLDPDRRSAGVPFGSLAARSAVSACRRAVERAAGPRHLYQLGRALAKQGEDGPAFETYRRAADLGSGMASLALGEAYREGRGVGRDRAQARALYEVAWKAGIVVAGSSLAELEAGEGGQDGDGRALRWLERGAAAGDPLSSGELADRHETGRGVARSTERALYHRIIETRLLEERGLDAEADRARLRRATLGRALPARAVLAAARDAKAWTPAPVSETR